MTSWIVFGCIAALAYMWWRKPSRDQRPQRNTVVGDTTDDEALDADTWDSSETFAPSNPRPLRALLELRYRDASGVATKRKVDVRECDTTNPSGYLIGFCRLRGANRTFRIDRIEQAVDMDTGEVIDNLLEYATKSYAGSPAASIDALFQESSDALRALFFVGKADGRFTAKEKRLFLDFCQVASGNNNITIEDIENACMNMPIPTTQAFKLICGRLSKRDESLRAAVLRTAEAMVATEKTAAASEVEALDYMRKRLQKAPESSAAPSVHDAA